jgi:hypothetical protein
MNLLKKIVVAASPNKPYLPVGKPITIKQIKSEQKPATEVTGTRKARIIKKIY